MPEEGLIGEDLTTQVKKAERQDPVASLWQLASPRYDLGDLNSFRNQLTDDKIRRSVYDTLSGDFELGEFEGFSDQIKPFLPKSFFETGKELLAEKGIVGTLLSPLPDKAEKFLETPLLDLRSLYPDEPPPETSPVQRTLFNVGKGVTGFVEGLTSPVNLALAAGTAALKGVELAGKLIPAIFSTDMAIQLPGLWEDITTSIENGDMDTATELITIGTLTAGTAGLLGKETVSRIKNGTIRSGPEATGHLKRIDRALTDPAKAAALEASMKDLDLIAGKIKKHEAIESVERAQTGEQTKVEVRALTEEDLRRQRQADVEAAFAEETAVERQLRRREEATAAFTSTPKTIDPAAIGIRRVRGPKPITEKALVPDRGKPIREVNRELAEIGDDRNLKPTIDIGKPRTETQLVGNIKPETAKRFNSALSFLEQRFPRLMSTLDRVNLVDEETYRTIDPNYTPRQNAVFKLKVRGDEVIGVDVYFKADNVIPPAKLERSPQVMAAGEQQAAELAKPVTTPVDPTVEHFVNTIAHEFRHAKDLAHFGVRNFLAMQEIGKISSLAEIEKRAARQVERGIRPQRYLARLTERRAHAQGRTAIRAFEQAVQEKTFELYSKVERLPSSFDMSTYRGIKPNLESIWGEFRSRGIEFAEFEKTIQGKFGKSIGSYVERFRQELEAESRATYSDPNEPVQSVAENSNPKFARDTDLPPDATSQQRVDALTAERDTLADHAQKWTTKLANVFSVEHRFLTATETAFNVKNFFSEQTRHVDEALKLAQNIASLSRRGFKPDPQFLQETALLAEQTGLRSNLTPEQQSAVKFWDMYKQNFQTRYKNLDVEYRPHRNVVRALAAEKTKRTELGENVRYLEIGLDRLQKLKDVTVEASLLMEHVTRKNPRTASLIYAELARMNKREVSLKSVLETGLIEPEQLNIVDLVGMAGRRLGQDSAILKIRKAAVAEELAKKGKAPLEEQSLWANAPAHTAFFDGYIVRTPLKEWLYRMTKPENKAWQIVDKGIASIKMAAFYNPFFLPMYDIYQAGMIGALKPHLVGTAIGAVVGGLPGAAVGFAVGEAAAHTLSRGLYHALAKTDRYFEANENGLSSVPYPNPFESHAEMFNRIKLAAAPTDRMAMSAMAEGVALAKDTFRRGELAGALQEQDHVRAMKIVAGTFPRALKNMYNLSWGVAWTLDRGVRMGTYEYMRGQGFGTREAAQIAARAHGDYASVPMETRKMLNRVFFTPTFKIAMAKFQTEMVTSAIRGVKAPTDVIKAVIGKTDAVEKLNPRQAQFAAGLLYTSAILTGYHLFMTSQGFDTDEFATKYSRPTLTDEGPKQLVVTHSTPANLFIKYWNRVRDSFSAGPQTALQSLANRFSWEITPAFRVANNMIKNRDDNGDPIILITDNDEDKVYKLSKYAIMNTYQMLGLLGSDENQAEARKKLAEESGQLFELTVRPFTFSYLKDVESSIMRSKLSRLMREFQRDIREGRIAPDQVPEHSRNLMRQMEDIRKQHLEKE